MNSTKNFFTAIILFASVLNAGELLYNGIELPNVWPPNDLDLKSTEPMPVPYLDTPPAVIKIDIGRQLFVDDFLIETTNLTRRYHSAEKYQGNPVFVPESETELKLRGVVYLGHGGVFYDPQAKVFKMFYTSGWRGPLALATSTDMIHWTRPELTNAKGNILTEQGVDDTSVWLDLNATNPAERIKFMDCDRKKTHYLCMSADGSDISRRTYMPEVAGDYCSFFYNPFREVWAFSIKKNTRGRNRYYLECKNFLDAAQKWQEAVYWTNADKLDLPEPQGRYPGAGEPTQLYSLNAVAYESIMVGIHYIHRGPNNKICEEGKFPKITDLELGFSRDGFHWSRPQQREPFIAGTRKEGDWDRAYLHSTTGVFVLCDDKLVFPYTAFSGEAPDGSRGIYHGARIGLAYLRRDGFASMDADNKTGELITRPVQFTGQCLFANLKATEGTLKAELLNEQGQPIEPFTFANSIPATGDKTLARLKWQGGDSLEKLQGKPVRFRFVLTDGLLYSFWVSRDNTGRSDGYLAAGAPGYDSLIDNKQTVIKQ